jgi:hypothetical protein
MPFGYTNNLGQRQNEWGGFNRIVSSLADWVFQMSPLASF